jgi:hypothetical protein
VADTIAMRVKTAASDDTRCCTVETQPRDLTTDLLSAQVHGVYWGSYAMHAPRVLRKSLEDSVQWLALNKIKVPVSHR